MQTLVGFGRRFGDMNWYSDGWLGLAAVSQAFPLMTFLGWLATSYLFMYGVCAFSVHFIQRRSMPGGGAAWLPLRLPLGLSTTHTTLRNFAGTPSPACPVPAAHTKLHHLLLLLFIWISLPAKRARFGSYAGAFACSPVPHRPAFTFLCADMLPGAFPYTGSCHSWRAACQHVSPAAFPKHYWLTLPFWDTQCGITACRNAFPFPVPRFCISRHMHFWHWDVDVRAYSIPVPAHAARSAARATLPIPSTCIVCVA